jgi:N-acetylglutamate synthase-like GNAT family acetyltransferase
MSQSDYPDPGSYYEVVPSVFRKDHVRMAREEDAATLARLHPATNAHSWSKRIAAGGWIIADDDGTWVGYAHLEKEDGVVGHLREFEILQRDRRVGDALVRKAVSFARRLGCASVDVWADLTDPDTYPKSDYYYDRADGRFWTQRHFVRGDAEVIHEEGDESWADVYRFVRQIEPLPQRRRQLGRRVVI